MRFLHTADWHIGKIVNDFSILEYQAEAIDQIIQLLKQTTYDCLVIAGDLYDRSVPSMESLKLVDEKFKEILLDTKTPILCISGNHDSSQLIEQGNYLLEHSHLYTQGTVKETMKKVTIKETDFYLFPFITPFQYSRLFNIPSIKSFQDIFEAEINKLKFTNKQNVLISHGYFIKDTTIFEKEDSVRPLSIGTAEYVDVNIFNAFDYVASGHLHSYHQVGSPKVQYSGSLYKYSKSEAKNTISVNDVSIINNQLQVTRIPLTLKKDLIIKKGYLEDLIKDPTDNFVFYELLDKHLQLDAMNKLKAISPFAMGLNYEHIDFQKSKEAFNQQEIKNKSIVEMFEDYYNQTQDKQMNTNQKEYLTQILREVQDETH